MRDCRPVLRIARWWESAIILLADVCGFGILGFALLIMVNVILRESLGLSIPGLDEVIQYALLWVTLLPAVLTLRLGTHPQINLVPDMLLPRRHIRYADLAILAVGFFWSLIIVWLGGEQAIRAFASGAKFTGVTLLPKAPFLAALPVTAALLAVEFVVKIAKKLAR